MRIWLSALLCSLSFGRPPLERLEIPHLEAVHSQRIQWMKQRLSAPQLGVYQDFRAVFAAHAVDSEQLLRAARRAEVRVVLFPETARLNGVHEGVLFLGSIGKEWHFPAAADSAGQFLPETPKERRRLETKFKQYPDEVFAIARQTLLEEPANGRLDAAFRNRSTHILARALTEAEIRASLVQGRTYYAQDWLCDPAGFSFVAESDLGVFEQGDAAPIMNTHIQARVPVAAKIKLFRNDSVVAEASDSDISYKVTEEGSYRLEAWLPLDGEEHLWISSNPLRVVKTSGLVLPSAGAPPNVEVRKDLVYMEGDPADASKHKLDLYLPKDKRKFPVMLFLHGGSWRSGDRGLYAALGNRFAKLGIGVAIPSYRLMPKHPHPAQIEDAAAAFAWLYKNIAETGGDTQRLYLVGHSAGGHLAALLALDGDYLKKYDIPAAAIHGVAALSGVYDLTGVSTFTSADGAPDASPLHHVHRQAPPFLVTYCQWDYLGLPKQARDFTVALKKNFVGAQLLYVPGKSHITEMVDIWRDDDPTAHALLDFVK